jgi:hypothetical protein
MSLSGLMKMGTATLEGLVSIQHFFCYSVRVAAISVFSVHPIGSSSRLFLCLQLCHARRQ